MSVSSSSSFHEEQRFAPWVYLLLAPIVAGAWAGFVWQVVLGHRFGSKPAPDAVLWIILLFVGILLPAFFGVMKLVTDVTATELRVSLSPLKTRVHRWDEIADSRAVTYSPIGDYGGWGIRYGGKEKGWAYNTRGNEGVRITLSNGELLLIGSGRARELAEAIAHAREG